MRTHYFLFDTDADFICEMKKKHAQTLCWVLLAKGRKKAIKSDMWTDEWQWTNDIVKRIKKKDDKKANNSWYAQ